MTGQAQITSVEAIESFRGKLIVYLAQARSVLDEAASELSRTRLWLQNDQRAFWDHEMRMRARKLEEAKQELFNARLSQFQDSTALQLMAVQRTQRAVQDVENHLVALKKWDRELENRAAPLMKQTEQLQGFLGTDMARAVAFLDQALKALEAYQTTAPPGPGKPAAVEPARTGEAE
jgi:hypothetical protein